MQIHLRMQTYIVHVHWEYIWPHSNWFTAGKNKQETSMSTSTSRFRLRSDTASLWKTSGVCWCLNIRTLFKLWVTYQQLVSPSLNGWSIAKKNWNSNSVYGCKNPDIKESQYRANTLKNGSVAYYFVTVLYILGNNESIVQSGMLVHFAQVLSKKKRRSMLWYCYEFQF